MNPRRWIIYGGVAMLVGLYLYDRNNSDISVLPATVTALEARDDAAGPDSWHITAEIEGQQIELAPLTARPDVATGDRICVARITRAGHPDSYRRANARDSC